MELLNIMDITVNYGKDEKASVKNFNLTLQPGEIIALVGESGSGKTTVLRSILGLLQVKAKWNRETFYFREFFTDSGTETVEKSAWDRDFHDLSGFWSDD